MDHEKTLVRNVKAVLLLATCYDFSLVPPLIGPHVHNLVRFAKAQSMKSMAIHGFAGQHDCTTIRGWSESVLCFIGRQKHFHEYVLETSSGTYRMCVH